MLLLSRLTCLSLLAATTCALSAQAERARRTCQVGRVAVAQAPRIDARLDDPCWAQAPTIGELVMVEPWLGRAPKEQTVVRLLHDRDNLYIGVWCEQDPATVRASQRVRDARLDPDDRIEILLDPFENRRTAYFFQIGAGGSLGDAIVSANGSRFNKPWDALWRAQARVTDDGWVAELAIPFRSIPRKEGATAWGFNLRRIMRDRNEEYQWDNPSQAVSFFRVSELGTARGFGEVNGGIGLEVVPYLAGGMTRDRTSGDGDWDFDPNVGGEMYYRVLPSLTFATTVLTDFAQTENDGRQINLNRFPLFFPEKRDFFLDGESYYTFGSQFAGGTRFLPYFTRRIGLIDGAPVPILWGMKLQGEAGPFEIGLLDVQVDGTATTDQENLAVSRVKYALGEQTTVGLLGTNGDPQSGGSNSVYGVDFYHRVPQFLGDMDLRINLDAVGSTGDGPGNDGDAFGIDLQATGQEWSVQTGTRWVSDDFDPALGFVSRRGIRQSEIEVGYRPRVAPGSAVRRYLFEGSVRRAERWQGEPQEVRYRLDELGVQFQNDDRITFSIDRRFDRVFQDFTLFERDGEQPRATVREGDYWTTRTTLRFSASEGRPVSGEARISRGDFFGGESTTGVVEVDWRATALLQLGAEYRTTDVDLGQDGRFTTHIASSTIDLFFSPELSVRNLVQYDNESNAIGWQSRLRWIYDPGREFFFVLGTTWQRTEDESIIPTEQALNLKVAHTLRF
ncbi:MAG: carbohydrate binding family 9 domain-containing protein [Planctomycetota bacterium]|nr:carbohydrate binding family 9 domain-containing protein [Planctomycetota bacterium]